MKKIRKIKIKGKIIEAEVCDDVFSRARGLMFRRKSKPLLFIFNEPARQSIHSFFCPTFKAIWINKNKIIDEKIIKPFSLSVKPKRSFTHLVEIPLKDNNKKTRFFVDNRKI